MKEIIHNLLDMIDNLNCPKDLREQLTKTLMTAVQFYVGNVLGHQMTQDEIYVAKNQGKIHAVKLIRARLNMGLKEAKDFVEAEAQRLGFNFYGY